LLPVVAADGLAMAVVVAVQADIGRPLWGSRQVVEHRQSQNLLLVLKLIR
jgi:hypothetical protein